MELALRTLVLSRNYAPVNIVAWRHALGLTFLGKAEVVDAYDRPVRSVAITVNIPSIIRLLSLFQRQRVPAKFSRNLVYARDKYTCQYCGVVKTTQDLSCDHIVPRSHGGGTTWTNIVTCCKVCNRRKAARTPDQAGMQLRKTPQQPTLNLALGLWARGAAMPDGWRCYLYGT